MAFYMSLENKLDIDNDTDIISSHTGGGGGGDGAQATRQLRQPRIFASLFQLLWIDRYISLEQKGTSIAYTSPPPPRYYLRRGGGGVAEKGQDTVKSAWCLGRAQCMIWVYLLYTVIDAYYRGGQNFHVFSFLLKLKV